MTMVVSSRMRQATARRLVMIDAIDDALAAASRSRVFLTADAARILDRLSASVQAGGGEDPRVEAIIAAAVQRFAGDALVDRAHLVDPLLDLRLAVATVE